MSARAARLLRAGVVLAILGTLAAAAAAPTWHLMGEVATRPPEIPLAPPPRERASPDIAPIEAVGLFGTAAGPEPEGPAEATGLALVLRGVVLNADPALSYALISDEDSTRAYRPGEAVGPEATLLEVGPRQVVLDVAGRREALAFPEPGGAGPAAPAATSGVARLRAVIEGGESSAPTPETTDDYVELWRERIRRNPGEVLDAIGLIPDERGYIVAPEHDAGVRRAGLRAGDLVTSVNGKPVGDVERDRELYDEVAASDQARIEIERDGRSIVMTFPLR